MNIRAYLLLSGRRRALFTLSIIVFLLGPTADLFCQQALQPDAQFVAPKRETRVIQKKVEKETLVTPDGILTKAYQSKKPWEMFSPFAPASYGSGEEMISEDPNALGQEDGLIIFGIQW
jgi:hypothetical protein